MSNYENGPEEIERIPRMPDAVLECIIDHSLFRYLANRYEGEDRDRLHGLMHDTAEEVLARVSIATPSSANGAVTCPACQGNDADMPCAYPSGRMKGCVRDVRLSANGAEGLPELEPVGIGGKFYYTATQLRAAVLAERSACAAIADSIGGNATTGDQVADYIRARK